MKIDPSATNYASTLAALDQGEASKGAHPEATASTEHGASAIVSISDSAKLAAQAADADIPPPPSIDAPDNPAISAGNNPDVFLDKLLLEMLSGRKIQGISVADLQAVRDSGANSDLLLKRIERAALRAGFAIERQIPQEQATVDQTTFQAKGVVRAAHDS
ncbi:hypothetical protein [Janthinobacterium sp. 17J80-10]|uniref:hypothetical protein n=1 Tax=Janthinobacterium sp. 17J80-10 TaxID=2497863 RepID=UPI0010056D4E|nr:hypothetical protein [Janthinobacterium sp. 17J80-10]QAU33735.1 hypothetical protein EKL02_05790 [Janthinobacterium sp. 17J80-10]